MGLLRASNPWGKTGGTLNMQRSDLWVADMTKVYDLILPYRIPQKTPNNAIYLPPKDTLQYFVRSVQFPDTGTTAETIYRGGTPLPYPGADIVCPSVRMVFALEAGDGSGHSRMYDMMEAWRNLVRAGREGYAGAYSPTLLKSANYQVKYREDIDIHLLTAPPALSGAALDQYFDSKNNQDFVKSASYRVCNAWVGGLQISEAQYEGTSLMTVAATIYADHILGGYGTDSLGASDFGGEFGQDTRQQEGFSVPPTGAAAGFTLDNQSILAETQPSTDNGKSVLALQSSQMITPSVSGAIPRIGPSDNSF